jgi:hypothetical protein
MRIRDSNTMLLDPANVARLNATISNTTEMVKI